MRSGPLNARGEAALPCVGEMLGYAAGVERSRLRPGSWAARLFEAADEGPIEPGDVAGMLIDYIAPSLDTTILGTGHLLFQLGRHPEQWARVRADPGAGSARDRRGAPPRGAGPRLHAFRRRGLRRRRHTIPAGDRVLILFASANRDERRYVEPDRFDVTRDAKDHLALI